ncbi:histone-like nucleoid-structuring protein Lsr2 [Streptomyces boncukensis]|uniref:Lsr2 family protein n=1 Tax=Streptomyces boncukensis TaxID=2711219 RepID=A0A6G4X9F6_9ACTN|nr:Lsr2 family protein [Streptomyces boncukensis]NGO73490.1 Lsr2 family protein [Streptomyces boncukensis]
MAQRVITIVTDDLTGEESTDAQTHILAVDGVQYEIDLAPDSYDKLMEALNPFLTSGRRLRRSRTGGPAAAGKRSQGAEDTAKIRTWAREQGYEVSDRGRVPANIREAFEKAH